MGIALLIALVAIAVVAYFLVKNSAKASDSPAVELTFTMSKDGPFDVDAVGESHHQEALTLIAGGKSKDGVRLTKAATLVLDSKNRYDPQAVAIHIDGHKVGHLSRDNARRYRERLAELGTPEREVTCPALIVGGWKSTKGEGHFGVKLDLSDI